MFLLFLTCVGFGCRPNSTGIPTGTMTAHRVSLVRLIAVPEIYHNKVVDVAGYLVLEHEGNVLYLDDLHYQHKLSNNGIWLDTNTTAIVDWQRFNKQYVEILATFDSEGSSDQTLFSGKLQTIRDINLIPVSKTDQGPRTDE